MARRNKTFDRVMDARGAIAFRDVERLLVALGFRLDRTSGSHRIYTHPKANRPLNLQP